MCKSSKYETDNYNIDIVFLHHIVCKRAGFQYNKGK